MNNKIEFLKNGGIHIKKKNKGKFTEFCNGKVTLECINRGFFSDNGKKVIKYNNRIEGGGGISYIVTDPSVFYNPQNYNWNQIFKNSINYSKYPLIYEINK